MKRTIKKRNIILGIALVIISLVNLNIVTHANTGKPELILASQTKVAMASGEVNTDPIEDPIIVPTGIVDWFLELIGY